MALKVYPASKSKWAPMWAALKAAGVPIAASFPTWPFNYNNLEPSRADFATHWRRCCQEASEADIVLIYAQSDESQNGALLEVGAGLGMQKKIFAVTPHKWSWLSHENVTCFSTLSDAITAILELDRAA
jgi:hypothetical protein